MVVLNAQLQSWPLVSLPLFGGRPIPVCLVVQYTGFDTLPTSLPISVICSNETTVNYAYNTMH